ncbi:MAG: hypothetical protein IMZ62_12015, partial [Chloroflexi bacterium]|nr:hypothetical protein [Chloroflexota bacterium]
AAAPSTNGANGDGRDARGRFTPGNSGGPGNPHVRTATLWREAVAVVVTPENVRQVLDVLVREALAGKRWAVAEFLDRFCDWPLDEGPPQPPAIQVIMPGALTRQMMEIGRTTPPVPGLLPLPDIAGQEAADE